MKFLLALTFTLGLSTANAVSAPTPTPAPAHTAAPVPHHVPGSWIFWTIMLSPPNRPMYAGSAPMSQASCLSALSGTPNTANTVHECRPQGQAP